MMDQDYKVIAVSPGPAKEYTNNYGTTYYRDVRIADAQGNEHPKPVSLGKKDANAHQVGMELHGHVIVEQSFPTDKFKAASKQQGSFGGGGFQKPAGNPYAGSAKPAYKDNSDGMRQGMCFNNAASYLNAITEPGKESPLNAAQWAKFVHDYANELYKLGDLGGETPNPKVPVPQTGQSKPWQVNTRNPDAKLWPSDSHDAEAESLYRSIAQAETVPDSDLPGGW